MEDPNIQDGLGRRFRWICLVAGFAMLFFSIRQIWRGGLQTLDWAPDASFSAMAFWLATDPVRKSVLRFSWTQRIFWLCWMGLTGASTWHERGWPDGITFIAIGVVGATQQETGPCSMSLRKPLGLLCAALSAVLVGAYIRQTGEWVPTCCVALVLLVLGYQPAGRRSLRENLGGPSSLAWAVSGLGSAVWFWTHPSFGHFIILVGILILCFGNLLLHLSSPQTIEHGLLNPQS